MSIRLALVPHRQEPLQQYLSAGAKQVWVLYPKTQDIWVCEARGIVVLKADGVLQGGDLLPGFAIKVKDLFLSVSRKP